MTQLYLISPPKFDLEEFSLALDSALSTRKVAVFQLRMKDVGDAEIIFACKKLIPICKKYKTLFILNDRFDLALKIGADGVHIGGGDGEVAGLRKKAPKGFIIGASCYDSKHRVMVAAEEGADYVSLGAFFPSKTKQSIGKPDLELLKWCVDFINVPVVCIGGIDDKNCEQLVKNGADFLSVISYVWQHEKGPKEAVLALIKAISSCQ